MTQSQALAILRKARKPKRRCSLELKPAERIATRERAKAQGLTVKQLYFVKEYKKTGCIKQAQRKAKAHKATVNDWLRDSSFKELIGI